jgi:hypothetical protein
LKVLKMKMSEDLPNIELFHKCVAVVLNKLYENFPNPIDIDAFYIEDKSVPKSNRVLINFDDEMAAWEAHGYDSDNNPMKSEMKLYASTIQYLREENILRTDNLKHGFGQRVFPNCILTSKGLTALGKKGVKEQVNWGQLMHAVIKDGKYKALKDIAIEVLSNS